MPKSFFSANSYDNQFNISTSDNPQGATVSEGLSGNAHLLKSADNSVAYKNLTGSQIEDTTLVQGSHNKTLQTDWTDEYDNGVNTDLTETAPIINNQAILTQSHSSAYNNLNENVNTTNEAHSIKTPTWQAFHQNIQTQTPTTLNQTLAQSGSNTTGTLQSQVQTQNTNASNFNHNFGSLTQNGNVNLSGTSQVGSQTLNIGGPADTSPIDFTMQSITQGGYPKVSGQIFAKVLNLPPVITQGFIITGTLELDGSVEAQGKNSVPVTVSKKGISLDLQNTINDYFAGLSFESISNFLDPDSNPPTIVIGNQNQNFTFSSSLAPQMVGPCVEVVYISSMSASSPDYEDWQFSSTSDATLTITFTPNTMVTTYKAGIRHAEVALSAFHQLLQQAAQTISNAISTVNPVVVDTTGGVALVILAIVLIPVGA